MQRVLVLLSSYNGVNYIREQIDSILSQKNIDVRILIRDDGSSDGTIDVIYEYLSDRVSLVSADNIGATGSFIELLKMASKADYYAFSDQDDVWDDNKLHIAIEKLQKYSEHPAMYSSNTRLVDNELGFIKSEDKKPRTTLGSALVKNYATGCTVVFNNALMVLLKKSLTVEVPYHDWWVNLVTLAVGGISIFDDDAHMMYRQHGDNVVGGSQTIIQKWMNRLKRFLTSEYHRDTMAKQLLDIYENQMSEENQELLKIIMNYKKNKLRILRSKELGTGKRVDDFLFKICALVNKI